MANYCCMIRTNYFRVKDEDVFLKLMNTIIGGDAEGIITEFETDEDGVKRFMFYCDGCLSGVAVDSEGKIIEDYNIFEHSPDDYDVDYDAFLEELQKMLPDDEAIIITEVGNEKMVHLIGSIIVITSKDIKYKGLDSLGKETAKEMLKNPDWDTKNEY